MNISLKKYFKASVESSTLAFFRVFFGLQMIFSLARFWKNGWIESIYIEPNFHFKYFGFGWVQSLGDYNYILFVVAIISALFITVGYKYKISIITFFLTFTYIELIDSTTYLNHYYFISVLSFILIFIPANCTFSIDSFKNGVSYSKVSRWNVDIIKFLLVMLYFFAGLAKINTDWLLNAMPLHLWLPGKYEIPLVGSIVGEKWFAYVMSWCGMLFDLSIGFLLLFKKTRHFAYFFVVVFHLLTAIFFPSIGMFPYIMITSTLIFLSPEFHNKIIGKFRQILNYKNKEVKKDTLINGNIFTKSILVILLILQLLIPLRHNLYEGELFWTEQGYKFSWRVMLVEKKGNISFTVIDEKSDKRTVINNEDYLTPFQEKQMSFQPEMILQFAHYLKSEFIKNGYAKPNITVDSFVNLNGRLSRRFIKKDVNLLKYKESFKHKDWIIPLDDDIKGF